MLGLKNLLKYALFCEKFGSDGNKRVWDNIVVMPDIDMWGSFNTLEEWKKARRTKNQHIIDEQYQN